MAREQGFPYWAAMATLFWAGTAARHRQQAEASALFEQGMKAHRALGTASMTPCWSALVAPMLAASDAEVLLTEQLHQVEVTDERWCEPEIHRVRGEVAHQRNDPSRAQVYLEKAIAIARRQDARHWELRACCSLARLWAEDGERQKAHDLVAPIYGWLTEGFDTLDLQDAKALLDELR